MRATERAIFAVKIRATELKNLALAETKRASCQHLSPLHDPTGSLELSLFTDASLAGGAFVLKINNEFVLRSISWLW